MGETWRRVSGQGFTPAADAARTSLFELSRTVIGAVEAHLRLDNGALASLLDDGTQLAAGHWSSTQHRLCLYHVLASPFVCP